MLSLVEKDTSGATPGRTAAAECEGADRIAWRSRKFSATADARSARAR
jgi:hypothetical protein